MLILLSLLNQSGMSAPLPLVTTFRAVAYKINGSFGWVEYTQLLGSGLGSMVGLNLQCSCPVEMIEFNAHNNQRNALNSAQMKVYFVDKFSSSVCGWI